MCMKKQCLGVCLPTRYGVEALCQCGVERIDRVPDCKRWITNKIRIVLPSKYGNRRSKGWLCPYLCGIKLRKAC
jgi:hypothetical protein